MKIPSSPDGIQNRDQIGIRIGRRVLFTPNSKPVIQDSTKVESLDFCWVEGSLNHEVFGVFA